MKMKGFFLCLFLMFVVLPFALQAQEGAAVPQEGESLPKGDTEIRGEERPQSGYIYKPRGRRDPFIPLVDDSRKKETTKKSPRVLGTLESYDIPDFKVIAIVDKGQNVYSGLVLAPDSKTFIVKVGSVMGLNKGKVMEISRDRILVQENIKDYKGELIPRQIVLELYEGGVK